MNTTTSPFDAKRRLVLSFGFRDAGVFIGLVVIFAAFAALTPTFLTTPNLLNVLQQSSINACIASPSA